MDFGMEIAQGRASMTWDAADTLANNVWLSLEIRRGGFFAKPGFGSRLHRLQRAKATESTRALAEEYAKEALQWLLDLGRATAVSATAEYDDHGRLALSVTVTAADGRDVTYDTFVSVI